MSHLWPLLLLLLAPYILAFQPPPPPEPNNPKKIPDRLNETPAGVPGESYQLIAAPTYEEMIAWAKQKDKLVEEGKLMSIGGKSAAMRAAYRRLTENKPVPEEDAKKFEVLKEILNKRIASKKVLEQKDLDTLREALLRLDILVLEDGDELKKAKAAMDEDRWHKRSEGFDAIYGSKGVRDKLYMFVWSLLVSKRKPPGRSNLDVYFEPMISTASAEDVSPAAPEGVKDKKVK